MSIKMWSVNMKIWILATIFNTVACDFERFYRNPDRIIFPDSDDYNPRIINKVSRDCENCEDNNTTSLEFAEQINELETYADYKRFFVQRGLLTDTINTRFGEDVERSNAVTAKPARCTLEQHLVEFGKEFGGNAQYYPSCTHVSRCGGCCNSDLWECQPVNKTMDNFKVYVAKKNNKGHVLSVGEEIVPIEVHWSCKCQCKKKAEHCTIKEKYDPKKCRCECNNHEAWQKCKERGTKGYWDDRDCSCKCPSPEECHTGLIYDMDICSCRKPDVPVIIDSEKLGFPDVKPYRFLPDPLNPRRNHKDEPH